MIDREWLDRVWHAYNVYQSNFELEKQTVDHFIEWLYHEYGIVQPNQRRNHE